MPPWRALAPALVAVLALAGCLTTGSPPVAPLGPADAGASAPPGFTMSAEQCVEAGFVAAYNQRGDEPYKLAGVWATADIREEIGNPAHDALGMPAMGPMFGNWHMGFRCAAVTSTGGDAQDLLFGYVGEMVEPPAWDRGGADLHFLVSGLGFEEGPLGDALRATTTADITPAVEARIDWYLPKELPRSAAYVVYVDGEKGVYESWSDLALLRDSPARVIRLWWQVPVDGSKDDHAHHNARNGLFFQGDEDAQGQWHPLWWDLHVSGGPQYTTPPQDGIQLGSHNMLVMEHGPVLAQPTLTNIYEYAWLRFTAGGVVEDVVLDRMWNH